MAMGYAVSGMVSDGEPGGPQADAVDADAPDAEGEGDEVATTDGTALTDLLFGSDGDGLIDDDAAAKTQDGGSGENALHLGASELAIGGADTDTFVIAPQAEAMGASLDPTLPRITDFQSGIDRLILEFDGPEAEAPEIAFDRDSLPDATLVLANGLPVVVLLGVGAIDLADVDVEMSGAGDATEGDARGDALSDPAPDGTGNVPAMDWMLDGGTPDDMLEGRRAMAGLLAGGDDAITGGVGDDTLQGGSGNDMLVGNEGHDMMIAGAGADEVYGEDGDDRIEGGAGTDYLVGGDGNDTLAGGDDDDMIFGGDGDDLLSGDAGDDFLQGGFGADTLLGGAGNDRLDGTFTSGATIFETFDQDAGDILDGGAGDDTILVGAQDIATGGEGADRFIAGPYIETAEIAGHVTDFDPRQDVIEVIFDPDLTPDPLITVEDFDDGTGANILFEGQVILSVSGAQGLDPALIELREVMPDRAA